MPYHRTVHNPAVLPHESTAVLPDGRRLDQGSEFTVKGEGRFRFHYVYEPDGSITAFGPVGKKSAQWRSFSPNRVRTIHPDITPSKKEKKS